MSDKTADRTAATAPHPVLKKYYESASERRPFVSALFDNAAKHYDWVCAMGSLGSGRFYRGWVLTQSRLRGGMKVLDVATRTRLVARAATRVLPEPPAGVRVHPSGGLLQDGPKAPFGSPVPRIW